MDNAGKKILIMAGGTGGHVFPGLALADALKQRGYLVEWLGTSAGIESTLVSNAGYKLNIINVTGVRGKGIIAVLKAPLLIMRSVTEAISQLRQIRPQLVVGMGGFAAGPGGVAARYLKMPVIIHEQNAKAGTTNKILARLATKVLTAFPGALRKSECIGNPVRNDIENIPEPEQRFSARTDGTTRILVLGGSRGARAINSLVPAALAKIDKGIRYNVRHQTGELLLDETRLEYGRFGIDGEVVPFIQNVSEALAWADLVICRSGALTVSELAAAGIGSILIPFPFAIDDHQTANAKVLSDNNAALLRQQKDLSPEILAVLLNELLPDRDRLLQMAVNARKQAMPGAAQRFASICEELING